MSWVHLSPTTRIKNVIMPPYSPKPSEFAAFFKRVRVFIVLFIIVAVVGVFTIVYIRLIDSIPKTGNTSETLPIEKYVKTEFGIDLPADFPTDIPLEEGAAFTQSYRLQYPEQKQLTVVFSSAKTLKENHALYADFFKKDGWSVTNQYESDSVSSLYAMKGSDVINITLSTRMFDVTETSEVNVSILKK